MKVANDIQHHLESIRYYSSKVKEKAREQFQNDLDTFDMTTRQGEMRMHLISAIGQHTDTIDLLCEAIRRNVSVADTANLERKEPAQ